MDLPGGDCEGPASPRPGLVLVLLEDALLIRERKLHEQLLQVESTGLVNRFFRDRTDPALGPLLGGYIIEYYSWRGVFFINVSNKIKIIFILQA